jgi:hypothetical protein
LFSFPGNYGLVDEFQTPLDFSPMSNLHSLTLRNFAGAMNFRGLEDKTGLRRLNLVFFTMNPSPLAGNAKIRNFLQPFTNLQGTRARSE